MCAFNKKSKWTLPIFYPIACDTTDCCQLMNHSHAHKYLKRNETLNINFEKNASVTPFVPKI